MRLLLAAVLALVAGCGAVADPEPVQAAPVDAGPALRECNGSSVRHLCGSFPATRDAGYGTDPSCAATPWLPTDADGGVAFRDGGQADCVSVGLVAFDGPPVARCCP